MEKPTARRQPELPGNVCTHDSAYRREWKGNTNAMRPIEPQPMSNLFKGSAINKASARIG